MEIDTAPTLPPTLAELAEDIRAARAEVRVTRAAPVFRPDLPLGPPDASTPHGGVLG